MLQVSKKSHHEDRRQVILTAPLLPLLVRMSVPTIIGMLVMVTYNLTDVFFVGLLLDPAMTAAVGVVFSFMSVIQAIGFLFGYGSGNTMSKRLGEKNEAEALAAASLGMVFALAAGLIIMVLTIFFRAPLAALIGGKASPALLSYTTRYLEIIGFSVPFSLYAVTLYNQLRLCGNPKDGMLGLLAGMAGNMILDPLLMFGFHMGFIGAAWATLAGQVIGCVVLTLLAERNGNIPVRLRYARFSAARAYHILAGGLPNFSRQTIHSLSLVLVNIAAAHSGDRLIAALTVSARVFAPASLIMIGWCQGFQPICAMNFGAGQFDRVKKAFRLTLLIGTAFLLLADLGLMLWAPQLIRLLSSDSLVIEKGALLLRTQGLSAPALCFTALSGMYLQNTGRYFRAMFVTVSGDGLIYVPCLCLFLAFMGESGFYPARPVSDLLAAALTLVVILHAGGGILSRKRRPPRLRGGPSSKSVESDQT